MCRWEDGMPLHGTILLICGPVGTGLRIESCTGSAVLVWAGDIGRRRRVRRVGRVWVGVSRT